MQSSDDLLNRKLRMGLIGGAGGFIGRVHAIAATLDGRAELAAGALSSDPMRARAAAPRFGIAPERAYGSYKELISRETELPEGDRIDFISIATPNFTHFEIARAALSAGLHVVCDKPMTIRLDEAKQLAELVDRTGAILAVAYAYSGYPLVRQARKMIAGGELGEIQAARIQYLQSGRRRFEPGGAPRRGGWKTDPEKAGPSGAMSDIGSHAFHLMRYLTGLAAVEVSCQLATYLPGGRLDDYGHALIRLGGGALGAITVSQVTHGRLNDLTVEVDGSQGALSWRQEEPNRLTLRRYGRPTQLFECNRRAAFLHEPARAACRLPGGHPEGFLEAFANFYGDALRAMAASTAEAAGRAAAAYPSVHDGVEGVLFIQQCIASSREDGAWKPLKS